MSMQYSSGYLARYEKPLCVGSSCIGCRRAAVSHIAYVQTLCLCLAA